MRPYYDEGGVTIYHGNCHEVAPLVRADCMLTDPPYGVNKADWDGNFLLPPAVPGVVIAGVTPGVWNLLRMPQVLHGLPYRWVLAAHLVNGMARGAIGFGNWIACVMYAAEDAPVFQQDGDCRDIVIGGDVKPDHPSPKPIRAWRWFLRRVPGEVVIDPFMGSGTTLLAAKDAGRRAIGIEIEERYCEVAAKRLSQGVLDFG